MNEEVKELAAALTPAAGDGVSNGAERKARPILETLEQVVVAVINAKGKPVSVGPKCRKQLVRGQSISTETRAGLLEDAARDALLAIPLRLLKICLPLPKNSQARRDLVDLVGDIVRRHEGFSKGVDGVSPLEARDTHDAFRLLATNLSAIRERAPRRGDAKQMNLLVESNALKILTLWLYATRETPLSELAAALDRNLWRARAAMVKGDLARLQRLIDSKDLAAIGLACQVPTEEANQQSQRAADAVKRELAAASRSAELERSLRSKISECDELQSALSHANAHAERLVADHGETLSRILGDQAILRAEVLRTLRSEISLLEEGLKAGLLDPPRFNVLLDHVDRALDGLRRERQRLGTSED